MDLLKIDIEKLLKQDRHAECYNCAERAKSRPATEIWTLYDGYPYCPDCAPYEVEY